MELSLAAELLFIAALGVAFAYVLWTRKPMRRQLQSDQTVGLLRSLMQDRWGSTRYPIRQVRGRDRRHCR